MPYRKFSTRNADYILRLGYHKPSEITPSMIFDVHGGVDAMVLEIRGSEAAPKGRTNEETLERVLAGKSQREDLDLVKYCENKKISLYILDPNQSTFELLKDQIFMRPIEALSVYNSGLRNLKRYLDQNIEIDRNDLIAYDKILTRLQGRIIAGRNAIWARKLEEYLSPKLKSRLGRKPKIGINIGFSHMGIERDLKHSAKRDFYLKRSNGKHSIDDLEDIYRADFNNGTWEITKLVAPIF